MLQCKTCGETKPATKEHFGSAGGGRVYSTCLDCINAKRRARRAENPEKYRSYGKQNYEKHKEAWIERKRQWRLKNREKFLLEKKRRLENPVAKMSHAISNSIRKSIKRNKTYSWSVKLGYNTEQLMTHLEKQFHAGMTWGNHGTYWHIDHIKPISSFDNYEGWEKDCWSLPNLRPLKAKENLSKNDKVLFLI